MIQEKDFGELDFNEDDSWYVHVTPDLASEILAKRNYKRNRNQKRRGDQYAADMRKGQWHEHTGETIKFTTDGLLIDGQHRLAAIIKAERPVKMEFRTGLPMSAYDYLDSGASRSDADPLEDIVQNATSAVAVSRKIMTLLRGGGLYTHYGINVSPTRKDIIKFCIKNDDAIQGILKVGRRMRDSLGIGFGITPYALAYWLMCEKNRDAADDFAEEFSTRDHKHMVVRERIIRKATEEGKSNAWLLGILIYAFECEQIGKEIKTPKQLGAYKRHMQFYIDNARKNGTMFSE